MTQTLQRPPIAIVQSDFLRLSLLAETLVRQDGDLADQLYSELVRADIVDDPDQEGDFVRMGSTLEYETASGDRRVVTLVFPQNEDYAAGRISILTPVGVALIGLRAGDSMDWRRPDGAVQRLKVTRIFRPGAAPADAGDCTALTP
jgi:regulator of nucleoside diphosphate kinase